METRKGVNFRIGGGAKRSRWVHHDELRPWRMSAKEGASVGVGGQELDAAGSRGSEAFGSEDSGSDSSSGSEGSGLEDEEQVVEGRPQRSRRQLVWMKDNVV